jgi:oligopeptide/dipeptide ABC transporter ATP-binding protein
MYAGRVVEHGRTSDVFERPKHPYTWSLLRSLPRLDRGNRQPLRAIEGAPPDLANLPMGCKFHPRCQFKVERCLTEEPTLEAVGPDHRARCWVTQAGVDLVAPSDPARP